MALQGTQGDLVKSIIDVLKNKQGIEYCSTSMDLPDEDGNIRTVKEAVGGRTGGIDYATKPNPVTTNMGQRGSDLNGIEAVASIVAEKVLDHIIENYELAAQARFDQLETDYNNLLAGLMIVAPMFAPNAFGAGAGQTAAMIAAVMLGGGPMRSAKTTILKTLEKVQSMNTGNL